jgi:hypothetical protein
VFFKDFRRVLIYFYLPFAFHSSALKAQVQAAYASKEGTKG